MVSRQPGLVGKNPVPPVSRILILGAKGRLGAALARKWAAHHEVTALARPAVDVSDLSALSQLLERTDFDVLVNGTGMTNVDQCEAARDEANMVNIDAPAIMARVAAAKAARFIHISTDYVFDGTKDGLYTEDDEAKPISHYGYTKLAGEHVDAGGFARHLAVRISWVFGPDKPSFIDMMLDRAMTYDHVEAIANKTSCPTYAEDVADWLEPFLSNCLARRPLSGLQHGRMYLAGLRPACAGLRCPDRPAPALQGRSSHPAFRPAKFCVPAPASYGHEHGQAGRHHGHHPALVAGRPRRIPQ